jgi:hypothetical protein
MGLAVLGQCKRALRDQSDVIVSRMTRDCLSCHMHPSLLLFVTHCSHGFSWTCTYQVPTTPFSCPAESSLFNLISYRYSISFYNPSEPAKVILHNPSAEYNSKYCPIPYACGNLLAPSSCGLWYCPPCVNLRPKGATEQRDLLYKQKHKMANVSHGRGGKAANLCKTWLVTLTFARCREHRTRPCGYRLY